MQSCFFVWLLDSFGILTFSLFELQMGAHRFTFLEKNLVVAATDLPDADDRTKQEKPAEHYSKTHVKTGVYGVDKLYVDNAKANEELRFYVNVEGSNKR
jgi:hypothetical protein